MQLIRGRFVRLGHGARDSKVERPRIGRNALAAFSLLVGVFSPINIATASAQEGRVIGGSPVSAADVSPTGKWGAVVAVFANDSTGTRLCTGALIAPNWVATAAHCLAQSSDATKAIAASEVFVASGATTIANAGDNLTGAVSTRVHPGFSWNGAPWDIALVELESTLPATPLALPDPLRASSYVVGAADNVAGFGRARPTDDTSSGTLRVGRLEAATPAACAAFNPASAPYADCYLPGPSRQATCFGDSGGPLVRFDPTQGGSPVLWGITSTGPDPCDAALSGAFAPAFETRVIATIDWIRSAIGSSTFVPTVRRAANTSVAPKPTTSKSTAPRKLATAVGGTGIGVFQTNLSKKPTRTKKGSGVLTVSFVGATGTGQVDIVQCVKRKCKTTSRKTIKLDAAGVAVKAKFALAKCTKKRSTITLKLTVNDASGMKRDSATQRLLTCK